jgi:RNA polymerase sigma-70 factor (ECF subfamily)
MAFARTPMRLRVQRRLTEEVTSSSSPSGNEPDERALLDAARAGDEHALGLLLDRHRHGLELYCYLSFGDRAKARTALAETALAAWEERGDGEPTTSARMWLYRLAVRVCSEAHAGSAISFGRGNRLKG